MKLELLRRKFKSCFSSSPHLNVIRGKVERFQNKKGSELLMTNGLGKQGFTFGFRCNSFASTYTCGLLGQIPNCINFECPNRFDCCCQKTILKTSSQILGDELAKIWLGNEV